MGPQRRKGGKRIPPKEHLCEEEEEVTREGGASERG
jgi:hypothetical protein